MNQCKNKAELHDQMARVHRMCEGTEVKPNDCATYEGRRFGDGVWLDGDPTLYSFAVAILEGKPVFVGDKPCRLDTGEVFTVSGYRGYWFSGNGFTKGSYLSNLSWNPPKLTDAERIEKAVMACAIAGGVSEPITQTAFVFFLAHIESILRGEQ